MVHADARRHLHHSRDCVAARPKCTVDNLLFRHLFFSILSWRARSLAQQAPRDEDRKQNAHEKYMHRLSLALNFVNILVNLCGCSVERSSSQAFSPHWSSVTKLNSVCVGVCVQFLFDE